MPALALLLAGCGASSQPGIGVPVASGSVSGTVTVFAAASLTGAFTTIGEQFEAAHPGVHVRFSFGGSDSLAAQIVNAAPADVFAAASAVTMQQVTDHHLTAGTLTVFVRNELEIAVPPGNPQHVRSLADVAKHGVKLALCAPTVPCGAAATKAFDGAGLTPHPVTLEVDVKAVLTKVALGEVDAGLVYRTDVQAAAGKVTGVAFPQAAGAVNDYPIAVLKQAPNLTAARAFVAYVTSPAGENVLRAAGFQPP